MFVVKEINPETLMQWTQAQEIYRLVDVRTPGETARGIIPGAELLPLHLLPVRMSEFHDARRIVFYCRTGARSAQACLFLGQQGISNVYNLQGGITAWLREGCDVVLPQDVHSQMRGSAS